MPPTEPKEDKLANQPNRRPSLAEMLLSMPRCEIEFERLDAKPRDVEF
jgi:hypothetical protein